MLNITIVSWINVTLIIYCRGEYSQDKEGGVVWPKTVKNNEEGNGGLNENGVVLP